MKRTVIESGDQNGWLCLGLCVCECVGDANSNPFRIIYISVVVSKGHTPDSSKWRLIVCEFQFNSISLVCCLSMCVCVCVRECCELFSVIVIHIQVRVVINSFPVLHGTSLQTDSGRHLVWLDLCFGPRFKLEFFIRKTSIQYIYWYYQWRS